jgi:hypothetical protein
MDLDSESEKPMTFVTVVHAMNDDFARIIRSLDGTTLNDEGKSIAVSII